MVISDLESRSFFLLDFHHLLWNLFLNECHHIVTVYTCYRKYVCWEWQIGKLAHYDTLK